MGKRMLYIDAFAGISGDMMTAALLDLGADWEKLNHVLSGIPLDGFSVKVSRVKKNALDCCDFSVLLDKPYENHDHDMAYLFGEAGQADVPQKDAHQHRHAHGEGQIPHMHRTLAEVTAILNQTPMTGRARELAKKIFGILAEAEGAAHGVPAEEVHFHEVGAVDSIVDIVAVSVCMDDLGMPEVVLPYLYEGRGTVRTAHGVLPIPVPAVTEIVSRAGIALQIGSAKGEYVTPTGAAISAAVSTSARLPDTFRILRTGLGAGKRTYARPSVLRVMEIETEGSGDIYEKDRICKLETNLDDCSGEVLGYTMEMLFAAGAKDVQYIPSYMKKNRPAWQLSVLCAVEDAEKMEEIIFRETTSIGIRRFDCMRTILARENREIDTPYGKIGIKQCRLKNMQKSYPEYESVAAAAREHGVPFMAVYAAALEILEKPEKDKSAAKGE